MSCGVAEASAQVLNSVNATQTERLVLAMVVLADQFLNVFSKKKKKQPNPAI